VTGLQFAAAIVNSLAWPTAVVAVAILLRRELADAFHRMRSFEFAGGKATFATLVDYEKMITSATPAGPDAEAIVRHEVTEFSVVQALASAAPRQAVIDAWGLLEYQLNVASDRLAPDKPHGWPQVARGLEVWEKWPMLYPVVQELRRLRDYTVESSRPPASADAARYVAVAQDVAVTLRTASFPPGENDGGDA
jgi:hypothetical protein